MRMILIMALALACWISPTFAADSAVLPPPTSVQDSPEAVETAPSESSVAGKGVAPANAGDVELRVYRRDDGSIVEEHALHGRVYMIRVQPAGNLPAYYLYDSDGDGSFERRLPGDYKHISPPMWVIKRF